MKNKLIKIFKINWVAIVLIGIVGTSFHLPLLAATYYVDGAVANDLGDGSQASPKKYINSGIALMSSSGGDTLLILAGVYTNIEDKINSVINGTPSSYNIIKAAIDGTVNITQTLGLGATGANQAAFVQFEGLHWSGPYNKAIIGHDIKILRCGFEGGPASQNTTNLTIGTNNQSPGAYNILIEDSWFYGIGGRYELLVFNSEKVVLRRIVVRHDKGWCFDGINCAAGSVPQGPPQAGLTVYSSKNIQVQNFIIIDSDESYKYWEAAYYIINNQSNFTNDNTVVEGSMAINNRGVSFKYDGSDVITNSVIKDSFVYGSGAMAVAFTGPNGSNAQLSNLTLVANGAGILQGSSIATNNLVNSIIVGNTNFAIINNSSPATVWTHSYNNCSNNGENNCNGTGETSYDAYTNGLLYPTRVENGSTLQTAGSTNGRIGAEILYKLGVSGTIYAETGFDQTTNESLWPWPFEDRIKQDMCDELVTGVPDQGWCASNSSLTEYVWGLLGNTIPNGIVNDGLFKNGFEN